ncbi:MAG: ABC transporter substrate-binding protein [Polyangiales bacterium]
MAWSITPTLAPSRRVPALALLLMAACSRGQQVEAGHNLPLDAPLPTTFAATTRMRLGDPVVEKQLRLNGEISQLPFQIDWQNVTGGPNTLEAFRGDALDGGAVGDTPPIHAAFTGLDVKIIAVAQRKEPSMKLGLAPHAGIKRLEDLRGKRIAYSPGQAQGALVLRVLRKLKLADNDVRLVELSSAEFKDALASDQVDVAPLGGPQLVRYLNAYGPKGGSAIDHGVRDGMGFYYVPTSVLRDRDKAGALRAYVALRTRAQQWAADHIEQWVREYYIKDQHLTDEEARSLIATVVHPSDWSEAIALTQETIDLIAKSAGRPSVDARQLFDLRFEHVAADAELAYKAEAAADHKPRTRDIP